VKHFTGDTSWKKRQRGRPRKHANDAERVRNYRKRKQAEGRRLDVYISSEAAWRLTRLTRAWKCTPGHAIYRLLLEADNIPQYRDIVYPKLPGPIE